MGLVMTSGPAVEPVTAAEAKAHLRIDGTAEDVLIGSLILTSRLHIETALGLALITQSWRLLLDDWPEDSVEFPLRPVQTVTAVRVRAADGTAMTLDADDYLVDAVSAPPRLVRNGAAWPAPGKAALGVEIEFAAGYGTVASAVPAPIRQALLMLVAHWYEHRDPIEIGSAETAVPLGVSELLMPYRIARV